MGLVEELDLKGFNFGAAALSSKYVFQKTGLNESLVRFFDLMLLNEVVSSHLFAAGAVH
jgi:hypothetical protein